MVVIPVFFLSLGVFNLSSYLILKILAKKVGLSIFDLTEEDKKDNRLAYLSNKSDFSSKLVLFHNIDYSVFNKYNTDIEKKVKLLIDKYSFITDKYCVIYLESKKEDFLHVEGVKGSYNYIAKWSEVIAKYDIQLRTIWNITDTLSNLRSKMTDEEYESEVFNVLSVADFEKSIYTVIDDLENDLEITYKNEINGEPEKIKIKNQLELLNTL